MFVSLSTTILSFLAIVSSASPTTSQTLRSRKASSSSLLAGQPGIITTVTSDNGTDLSSRFTTLVYLPPDEELVSPNITDRDLSSRGLNGPTVRNIDRCRTLNADFRMSMCDYHDGRHTTMQRYLVQCGIPNRQYATLALRVITEWGACNRDEICINTAFDEHGLPSMASCMSQRVFQPMPKSEAKTDRSALHDYLMGRMAMAVMSHPDSQTPMAVENMELDAGVAGSSRVGGQVGLTSQTTCDDCVQLASDRLAEGTDFLNVQAKVVGGLSAGAAGILWLAAVSG